MKNYSLIALAACIINSAIANATSSLQIDKLTCEYIENPLGIDTKIPRFNWTFKSTERNQFQSAYELIVSDNATDIQQQKGNMWSTGKITSSQNIQIEYGGKTLQSFTRYYWRVKVYNQNNEASLWSEISWFETSMLNTNGLPAGQAGWKAKWINDGSKNP